MSDYGSVSYTVNGSGRTASFKNQTGKVAHYYDYFLADNLSYEITQGNVAIDDISYHLSNPQSFSVSCFAAADLRVAKSVDHPISHPGEEINYTVRISNGSGTGTDNISVEDIIPQGITYVRHYADAGSYNAESGQWNLGALGANASATLTITALVSQAASGEIVSLARIISSNLPDPDETNNTSQASVDVQRLPPIAADDTYQLDEDAALTVEAPGVLGNDERLYGTVSAVITLAPANGHVVFMDDGSFAYSPNENYNGPDHFEYQVCVDETLCDMAQVSLAVFPKNDPPVANDDFGSTVTSEPLTLLVLHNDDDPDGDLDAGSVFLVSNPLSGSAIVNSDGTITYTPIIDFVGTDSFTYRVCDIEGLCSQSDALATILVLPGDQEDLMPQPDFAETDKNTPVTIDVLGNDVYSGEGELYIQSIALEPLNGQVAINSGGGLIYTPKLNYNGTDYFTYIACDTFAACDTAMVTITILVALHAPMPTDDEIILIGDDSVTVAVLENDKSDNLGDLYIQSISKPLHGTAIVNSDNTITYTPDKGFYGQDSFAYTVCENADLCSQGVVFATVSIANHSPQVNDETVSTFKNQPITINVLHNDVDIDNNLDPVTLTIKTPPTKGLAEAQQDGAVIYTPHVDFVGIDRFTYSVCDTEGLCSEANVVLEIAANDRSPTSSQSGGGGSADYLLAPKGVDDFVSIEAHESEVINVLANDVGNDIAIRAISFQPKYGSAVVHGDTIIYSSTSDFLGEDRLGYIVCRTTYAQLCSDATVTVVIHDYWHPPTTQTDFVISNANKILTIDVLKNDYDLDDEIDKKTLAIVKNPLKGRAKVNSDPTIKYIPDKGFVGKDSLEYRVCDVRRRCSTGLVNISIFSANHEARVNDFRSNAKKNQIFSAKILSPFYDHHSLLKDALVETYIFMRQDYREDSFNYVVRPDRPLAYPKKIMKKSMIGGDEINPECQECLSDFLKFGTKNPSDQVLKLQKFLRDYEGEMGVPETGLFDVFTFEAVKRFQQKYSEDVLRPWGIAQPTGYVYKTTLKKINELYCSRGNI